ncbi:MAG: SMP-30/gluconolactonase/LRE family protein [Bacteroidota bacterium]|nr:SMP-30/gluconolactonase/LRE family protein [Bacteroidota bacterium]
MRYITSIIAAALFLSLSAPGQDEGLSKILKPGAQLEKLAGSFSFTEGPAADAEGNVFFTDQPNDRIMEWKVDGSLSTFMQPSGRSNGMFIDHKGNLWSCADEKNELWLIKPDKKVEVIAREYEGRVFNGPNDVWVAPNGSIYLTDPFYRRSWWDHTQMPQDKQCVYYLSPDHKTIRRVADDLEQPNGIVGTSDGKTLYIADIRASKTWSYSVQPDGALTSKKLFCELGSDGMTIDAKGNIYLTGKGVTVFDKTGKQLGNIPVSENWTANVCFGGRDRKELFITASKGLYRIRTVVKGVW